MRLLIVDDHEIVLDSLAAVLNDTPGMKVVGIASTIREGSALLLDLVPDVVLADLTLDDGNASELLRLARRARLPSRILILTGLRDVETHRRAFRLGARGLVVKEAAAHTLMKAIRKVHEGEIWLDRTSTAHLLAEMSKPAPPPPQNPEAAKIAKLSAREVEVTAMLAEGLSNKLIADRLSISETTVRHHLTSIFAKLGVPDRLALLLYAHRNGLVKPPQAG